MTLQTSSNITAGYEPIAGYCLEEKIGEGGFGEVWRANAPGGIKKAVKFVFGATDEKRGSRELKSLERIKGVHHPFLLTLERFGIVDDRLIIVTELADGSLEDVLQRHIDRGSCGIPRAALLSYLHDAADALDYLHDSYQLQHLDVKPGNLLMVGGHVKVGDFGLLKDLRDNDQSVIGGLTPIYAPPELFDGRPAMNSDQYSLAVMFQELLTGTRPFEGRTIAQLATQHIHAAPNLEPLPPVDRVAVARALEKNPDRRFETCKAFIDALRHPNVRDQAAARPSSSRPTSVASATVEDLPEIDSAMQLAHSRVTGHALVIAVGGTGADVLHELRSRVANLHSACPLDLHSILIDTDGDSIHAARLAGTSDRVPPATLVHTPLKSASEYRKNGKMQFRSMSRRWIYNVPRSGTTEGMRPLGRLAMIDHAQQIDQAIRESLDHLAAVCGDRVPSIYLVGSLSGGTASGMVMDLSPRLRQLLDEAGLQHATVLPLLTTVPLTGNPHQPLTLLDTHAAVSEWGYYLDSANSYPGDAGVEWASVPSSRSPLNDAYLIADSDVNAGTAAASVVDYLWADATGAGDLLAHARKLPSDSKSPIGKRMMRSVGVARLQCVRVLEQELLAPAAVRHLLLRWLGNPAESAQLANPLAERLQKRCGFQRQLIFDEVIQQLGGSGPSNDLVVHLAQTLPTDGSHSTAEAMDAQIVRTREYADMTAMLDRRVANALVTLRRELATRLHDRRIDITSALQGTTMMKQIAEDSAAALDSDAQSQPLANDAPVATEGSMVEQIESLERFARSRVNALAMQRVADAFRRFATALESLLDGVEQMAVSIAQGVRCVPGDNRDSENPWDEMPQEIQIHFQAVLDHLHARVSQTWLIAPLQQSGGIQDVTSMVQALLTAGLPMVEDVIDRHRRTEIDQSTNTSTDGDPAVTGVTAGNIHTTLNTSFSSAPVTQTVSLNDVGSARTKNQSSTTMDPFSAQPTIEAALEAARPQMLQCGGRQRLLLLVGSEAERSKLEGSVAAAHQGSLTTVIIPGLTPMLIHEAQAIPVASVLERLELVSGANPDVVRRLHARGDVRWNEVADSTD
ncbi:MAG: protein kinase [Planctomycetota bacterium]